MSQAKEETAILAGGCFWCLEAVYVRVRGVLGVESGYCGGAVVDPTYAQVCNGQTGHAEAVRICFDPARISFRDLLEIFFLIHDPTTRNRQGNDVGTQYRSAIFWTSPEQQSIALSMLAELEAARAYAAPIVTELQPAPVFYVAEDYHQAYFATHPDQPYCEVVVAPKLAKFRAKLGQRFEAD
ncbi:MAG: peptide-methionine (S)-S-oxide reductase MsrA [Betaproteobacteria bacterium]|nr:peptide-methionine (S)-S-oxide reductase MsrA [Betaproteobacteria bacterium]